MFSLSWGDQSLPCGMNTAMVMPGGFFTRFPTKNGFLKLIHFPLVSGSPQKSKEIPGDSQWWDMGKVEPKSSSVSQGWRLKPKLLLVKRGIIWIA